MTKLRSALTVGAMTLALGGLVAPAASADTMTQAATKTEIGIQRVWHATVQCQIVRISDNNVVRYDRADGTGNTEEKAVQDAARNIPVPQGHYKRHCDTKRTW